MKTKRFEGKTKNEVLEKVREELGPSAIVLNIKKKKSRGVKGLFQKPTIVATAVYDENESEKDKVLAAALDAANAARDDGYEPDLPDILGSMSLDTDVFPDIGRSSRSLEEEIANQQQIIQQLQEEVRNAKAMARPTDQQVSTRGSKKYDNSVIQMFYDSLAAQGVSPEIAEHVLKDANSVEIRNEEDINLVVKIVYNKIMGILGEPRILVEQETGAGYGGETQVVIFMGPTGVGKTTTIAKLSSILLLTHHKQVGLVTSDTYRIAAVEQLRTYADIMGLDLKVIYSGNEIVTSIELLQRSHDVILVDTAGRSHHNKENILELKAMLDAIPNSDRFLVLSVTTREEDILGIIRAYEAISDFDLIFTKLDETGSIGVLLNICYLTGKQISYVTFGQNVPEDIDRIQPDKIAKALMGTGFDRAAWRET
jgi:flagellar biosynthesis protein FlhF